MYVSEAEDDVHFEGIHDPIPDVSVVLSVLLCGKYTDDFEAALTRLSSPEFRQEYRDCLERAGEIWTHEEVAAAVKTCIRVSAARRNEGDEELGDDAGDRSTYGLESKSFRQVVDFGRRFTKWARCVVGWLST